jgi:hypothetical protein
VFTSRFGRQERPFGTLAQYQPSLSLQRKDTSDGAVKLLARVYLKMDAHTRRDRWMLSFYPLGGAPLPFQNEDGRRTTAADLTTAC